MGESGELGKNREICGEFEVDVPADISSAAFFMVGAAITPDSEVLLKDVIVNPTRAGILKVFERMGVNFEVLNLRISSGEEVADIRVSYSPQIKGTEICGDEIPTLIDEIPVISLLASQAEGETVIRNAEELRVKESDRIKSITENLKAMGVPVEELPDGLIVKGKAKLKGGKVSSYGDNRIAMTFVIASLVTGSPVEIDDVNCIATSYPNFFEDLNTLVFN
jgi:3-phosphoshikimate 1-carboxyvinyltransferase